MYIKSPLNYTGGKYKLLDTIIPSFPQGNKCFVDLFTGGMNVGINVTADTIYANDQIDYLIELYDYFQKTPTEEIIGAIKGKIEFYALDQQNVEGYNRLRKDYNNEKSPLMLFVLTCYAFNHQIRFNNSFQFNTPFGKDRSSYNTSIENNLIGFTRALKEKNILLSSCDFREFDFDKVGKGGVVYCDPPYLITTGSYNDGKRGFGDWTQEEDSDLLELLDKLNEKGMFFALSNVFYHKGNTNNELIKWSEKYHVTYLDKKYSNCSYHFKDRGAKTVEVLVTNYMWGGNELAADEAGALEEYTPFLEVYPDYDLTSLPSWVADDIENAKVYGNKKRGVIMPDGQKYHLDNKLNDMNGRDWTFFINSVFSTHYPTRGKEGYAHEIRKIHPTPKPPQLMRDLICFFTKRDEIVFDSFMGVGGTLIGASLADRRALGIDLNPEYIDAYKRASKELGLKEQSTICGDCIEILEQKEDIEKFLKEDKISLMLIDPPYGNMMSKEKTGGDISVYGKNSTPFTESEKDLGNMDKDAFLDALKRSVERTLPYIKTRGYIVVFIKDLQPHKKEVNLLHADVISKLNEIKNIHYKGMKIWSDESTKLYPYGYPFCFVANQIHQYILVFRKEK